MIFYYWQRPHRLLALAVVLRLRFGRCHTMFVRTWSLGPVTLVVTDLTRPL